MKKLIRIIRNIPLLIKYPFLRFPNDRTVFNEVTWQDMIPEGWKKMSMQMWQEIKDEMKHWAGSDFQIYDIKEKYGCLDITATGPDMVMNILHKYEYISERTCIKCGAPAKYLTQGWIAPYCIRCIDDYGKANSYKFFEDVNWYGWTTYKNTNV